MNKTLLLAFICTVQIAFGQEKVIYSDLAVALKSPEKVFMLSLNDSDSLLTEVPSEISEFKNLRSLNLSECRIESTPDFLKDMDNLETLNLSRNNLKKIPNGTFELTQLKQLEYCSAVNTKISLKNWEKIKKNNMDVHFDY